MDNSLKTHLLSVLKLNEKISFENWLKLFQLDAKTFAKNKDKFLDEKIPFSKNIHIQYSGGWQVPNPTETITYYLRESRQSEYFVSDINLNNEEIKAFLTENKQKEKEHRKIQNIQLKRTADSSTRMPHHTTEFGTTTLRKILSKFDERKISSHNSFNSYNYNYFIQRI